MNVRVFNIDGVWVKVRNRCSILSEERKIKRIMRSLIIITKDREIGSD